MTVAKKRVSATVQFQIGGRAVEVMPPAGHDPADAHDNRPAMGMLRIDGRDVMYEQTDEGVYSHELMYERFSTPAALAEALVRQWGSHIPPPPLPMPMSEPRRRSRATRRGSSRRGRR
jgi:hypothetical protein